MWRRPRGRQRVSQWGRSRNGQRVVRARRCRGNKRHHGAHAGGQRAMAASATLITCARASQRQRCGRRASQPGEDHACTRHRLSQSTMRGKKIIKAIASNTSPPTTTVEKALNMDIDEPTAYRWLDSILDEWNGLGNLGVLDCGHTLELLTH